MPKINRDSVFWTLSIIGAIAIGLTTHFDRFPWIPDSWRNGLELTAFVYGILAGKMATSPLPGKSDDR